MRNYELIMAIYDRCPDPRYQVWTADQYFDRCQDIIDMIDAHRGKSDDWRQQQAGMDY